MNPPPLSRKPKYHHGNLREALIHSGLELLAESDGAEISLRAVAKRAGVSAMAPYRHFPDREALLAAVAARGFEDLRAALAEADSSSPPARALLAQAEAFVRHACGHPALFRVMCRLARSHIHTELKHAADAAYAVTAARVALETPEAGRLERAAGCWSLMHGLASLILDGEFRNSEGELPRDLASRTLSAMLTPLHSTG